jgi:hypothetical protein
MLYGLLGGLAAGWLGGGNLGRLEQVSIRWAPMAMVGLLAQLVLFLGPVAEQVGELGMPIYVISTAAVLVVVVRNARLAGLPLVAAGAAANLAAIVANGGYMPASAGALAVLGKSVGEAYSNSTVATSPALLPLTDLFALPRWLPFANVFSIGDVLICLGLALAVASLMRGVASGNLPRRYSQPGTSGS